MKELPMIEKRPAIWLVEWLAKEDDSAYAECVGVDLDRLIELGLAEVIGVAHKALTNHSNKARVRLTPHGWTFYALIRADKLVDWMAHYVGKMAPGSYSECYNDLNQHFYFMQHIKPPKKKTDEKDSA